MQNRMLAPLSSLEASAASGGNPAVVRFVVSALAGGALYDVAKSTVSGISWSSGRTSSGGLMNINRRVTTRKRT